MEPTTNRDNIVLNLDCENLSSKKDLARDYLKQMINRCNKMFTIKGLPPTINQKDLMYLVLNCGYCCYTKVNGVPYVFNCSLGGEANEYYLPTIAIVTNPYLEYYEQLVIDKDCVIIKCTDTYDGLLPIHKKYANLLAECDISLKYACWNSRLLNLIVAETDSAKKDAENILDKIVQGSEYGIIGGKQGLENIKTYPYSAGTDNTINSLLELRQYLYANWYIDLGVNANYNMKREALSSNEVDVNENTLTPLIDNIEDNLKEAFKKIEELFGDHYEVERNSSWYRVENAMENEQAINDLNVDLLDKQIEQVEEKEDEHYEVDRNEQSNDNEQTTSD